MPPKPPHTGAFGIQTSGAGFNQGLCTPTLRELSLLPLPPPYVLEEPLGPACLPGPVCNDIPHATPIPHGPDPQTAFLELLTVLRLQITQWNSRLTFSWDAPATTPGVKRLQYSFPYWLENRP